MRQKAFKLMEKVLKKYVLARRIDMRTDFQYVLLVMYHCPSRDQTFTREDLSDKQETKQTWFESLVSIVDTDEVPTEFLQDAFAQNLRRRIPCHFGDLRLSDFGRHVKKCRPISRQRYLVVSLYIANRLVNCIFVRNTMCVECQTASYMPVDRLLTSKGLV